MFNFIFYFFSSVLGIFKKSSGGIVVVFLFLTKICTIIFGISKKFEKKIGKLKRELVEERERYDEEMDMYAKLHKEQSKIDDTKCSHSFIERLRKRAGHPEETKIPLDK